MIKAAIRSRGGIIVFGYLVAVFIGLLMTNICWRRANRRSLDDFMAAHPGTIIVFWHERLFAMPYLWPSRHALCAPQSTHADGRMMAACIRRFGVGTIWGSSSRSALSGLRGMLRALNEIRSVAITPDGPRGPARIAARGAVALAQISAPANPAAQLVGIIMLAHRRVGPDADPETIFARKAVDGDVDPFAGPCTGERPGFEGT